MTRTYGRIGAAFICSAPHAEDITPHQALTDQCRLHGHECRAEEWKVIATYTPITGHAYIDRLPPITRVVVMTHVSDPAPYDPFSAHSSWYLIPDRGFDTHL